MLPAGTFPLWGELHAVMLHAYTSHTERLGLIRTSTAFGGCPALQPTGKEAYTLVEELSILLRRKGVSNPGQEEQNAYILQNQLTAGDSACWISLANADEKISDAALGQEEQNAYILQNQLTAGESACWISLANADEKISDAALNALELGAAGARTRRLSCRPPTQEAFFAARREHLRNFLTEQGQATTGDQSAGSSSARAAVSTGNDAAEPPAPPAVGVALAAVVACLQAHHMEPSGTTLLVPPHGTTAQQNTGSQ